MEIFELINIPQKAIPQLSNNNRIDKKLLIGKNNLAGKEKQLVEKSIEAIYIRGIITEDSSSIWSYKDDEFNYEEIDIFEIILKDGSKISQLNEIVQKSFQKPCLFIYRLNDKYALSTALKRTNHVDINKRVIEEIQLTNFFELDDNHMELLKKYSYSYKDLKEYYEYLNCLVAAEEIIQLTSAVPNKIDNSMKEKADAIKALLRQKRELEQEYKEADLMRDQMSIHMKIKEIEEQLEEIK